MLEPCQARETDLQIMSTTTLPPRRTLRFDTLQDILADCDQFACGKITTVGKWSYAEILEHLAQAIDCFYSGFSFQAPWYVRKLMAPLIRNRFLTKSMPAGINLPSNAKSLLPPESAEIESALRHLRESLARLERETPSHPHPAFGMLSHGEVKQLTLRHCELHLNFVVPSGATP